MKEKILAELQDTKNELLKTINSFTEESFNKVPFEGSWTAGQVCDHLYQSDSGALMTLDGKTAPTERDPKDHIDALKGIFLNFEEKYQSPEFILPSGGPHNREKYAKDFKETFEGLIKFAETEDLSLTCADFPFPGIGELTRFEWLSFACYHSIRHIRQMKNIHEKLA